MKKRFSKIYTRRHAPSQDGFVLVYSVLVAGMLLAIAAGIYGITVKELFLSRFGRESQVAFVAADSGAECALYWDLRAQPFATSSSPLSPPERTTPMLCGGVQFNDGWTYGTGESPTLATTTFTLDFSNGTCAIVAVGKTESGKRTLIDSRGFNTCDENNPARVERGLRLRF